MLGETKKKRMPFSEGTHDGGAQVCTLKVMKITHKQNVTGLIMLSGLVIKPVVEVRARFYMLSMPFFPVWSLYLLSACLYIVYTYASTNPPLRSLRICIYNCRTVYYIVNSTLNVFSTKFTIRQPERQRGFVTLDACRNA